MKLSQVVNYESLEKYVKQNPNLTLKKVTPPTPLEDGIEIQLLIHYETPIAYIRGKQIYTTLFTKKCFISNTTAKISVQLCKFSNVIDIESFIHYVYEFLEYKTIGKNRRFYDDYVKSLVGE